MNETQSVPSRDYHRKSKLDWMRREARRATDASVILSISVSDRGLPQTVTGTCSDELRQSCRAHGSKRVFDIECEVVPNSSKEDANSNQTQNHATQDENHYAICLLASGGMAVGRLKRLGRSFLHSISACAPRRFRSRLATIRPEQPDRFKTGAFRPRLLVRKAVLNRNRRPPTATLKSSRARHAPGSRTRSLALGVPKSESANYAMMSWITSPLVSVSRMLRPLY